MGESAEKGATICPKSGEECTGINCPGPIVEDISYEINGRKQWVDNVRRCGRVPLQKTPAQQLYEKLLRYSAMDE